MAVVDYRFIHSTLLYDLTEIDSTEFPVFLYDTNKTIS